MSTKTISILVVAVIAVAGLGVYFLMDTDTENPADITVRLMIYGNANNDDYLDAEDVLVLQNITDGDADAADYPFADANQDGSIDEDDIAWVQRMIDRESMDIYYLNARGEVKMVSYPVQNVVVVGTGVMGAVKSIGAVDKVVGRSGGKYDPVFFSDVINRTVVSGGIFEADPENVSNIENVSAIITQDSDSYVENENIFTTAGIDVIRIAAADGIDSIGGIITLGYLMACEETANAYAEFCDGVLEYLEGKVGPDALNASDRVTALSVTMTNYVGGTISDYYAATEIAGADNIADWDTTTQRFNEGDEWLYSYDPDYIVHARSVGYGEVNITKTWDTYSKYFVNMSAYEEGNYVILNGNMPVIVRIAYMAGLFYPDIIGADYGNQTHQAFLDRFITNLGDYNVTTDGTFLITKGMVS